MSITNRRRVRSSLIAACLGFVLIAPFQSFALEAVRLRCDSAENPLGIDSSPPRLSWQLRSEERGARQTAWQILAAASRDTNESSRASSSN